MSFVSLLIFTWTDGNESQLILPFWMKNLFNFDISRCGEMSFSRIAKENVCEFEGKLRVEWFSEGGLKSNFPRFPFEEILPELLGHKRPLYREGTIIPFIFEGARYMLKFTPESCDFDVFWFNLETGSFQIETETSGQKHHASQLSLLLNDFGSWSEEFKLLKYQIENVSKDSKEAFLLCGVPFPLQEPLLDALGINFEKVNISNFIPEEHLQISPLDDEENSSSSEFLFIGEVEKVAKNLITEILRQSKNSNIILTSSVRSIESSNQLIQLEKSVRRFNFQVINCNFPPLNEAEKIKIIAENCGIEEKEVSSFKWALKSMDFVDLLRVCKQFKASGASSLKKAVESVKETDVTLSTSNQICSILPSQGCFSFNFFGYEKMRKELKSLIKGPLVNPEAYDRFNLPKSSGFLLHGPPGCGKTALCLNILTSEPFKSLFTVLHVPSASQMLSKYFGETEANIRRLFALARERKPAIIFFDQIECLGLKRGLDEGNGTATDRYLSTLLNEMDGISGNDGVTIIACANDIEMLDEALLRPGRLDRHFYLGLPEEDDRSDLIRGFKGCEEVDAEMIKETDGMTGAEIKSFLLN